MSKDKAEEKASEYVRGIIKESDFDATMKYYQANDLIYDAHIAGYTQAITDLSTENAQLREALTHLVNLCDANSYDEVILYQMEHNIDLDTVLNKAKQLLTDKE